MKKLVVAEVFYSLQCEGREIGVPAVFLRLAGCNLLCESKDWRCDTIEVWQKGISTSVQDVIPSHLLQRLRDGAHLVITGGEPLLQQRALEEYLSWLEYSQKLKPIIEVETNGTVMPGGYLINRVSRWNVSPKLKNSGETYHNRMRDDVLRLLNGFNETIFKFVISHPDDVLEMLNDFDMIDMKKVMLMPAGSSREELENTRLMVVEQCLKIGVRYSERLHIVIWNQKTGV